MTQVGSALSCIVFAFTLRVCSAQLKFFEDIPLSQMFSDFNFPSESISIPRFSSVAPSNHNHNQKTSSVSFGGNSMSKYVAQPTIVAIPLYIRNPSKKTRPLFDILSASFAETGVKPIKSLINRPKNSFFIHDKHMSTEVPKQYQTQLMKHQIPQKHEQSKNTEIFEYSTPLSNAYNSIVNQGLGSMPIISIHSPSAYGASLSNNYQKSGGKNNYPKTYAMQQLTTEHHKSPFSDFASIFDDHVLSKLSNSQILYDTEPSLESNSKKENSNDGNSATYGIASPIGQSYGTSQKISSGINSAYDSTSGYSTATSLYGTGNDGQSHMQISSGFSPIFGDRIGSNFGHRGSSSGSSGQNSPSYTITTNMNGNSGGTEYFGRSGSQYAGAASSLYGTTMYGTGQTYGSGGTHSDSPNSGSGSYSETSYGGNSLPYGSSASTGINYASNIQGERQNTGGNDAQGNGGYSSGQVNSGIYETSPGGGYGPSQNAYLSHASSYAQNNIGFGADSGRSFGSSTNGEYYGSSNDDCTTKQPHDYTTSSASTVTSMTDTQKQLSNAKSQLYTFPALTSGITGYDSDETDYSKLDLKIVHLPVSVLKRLVGDGELALPSFGQ